MQAKKIVVNPQRFGGSFFVDKRVTCIHKQLRKQLCFNLLHSVTLVHIRTNQPTKLTLNASPQNFYPKT